MSQHDLPPRWDGYRVQWDAWAEQEFTSLEFHGWGQNCKVCQSTRRPLWARGTVLADVGAVTYLRKPRDARESAVRARGERLATLHAIRCQECAADHVLSDGRDSWDLDESDYGDDGSWEQ